LAAPALVAAGPVGAGPTLPCLQEKCAVFVDTCLLVSGCDKVITCMDACTTATCENLCFDDIAVLSGCGGANGCFHYDMVAKNSATLKESIEQVRWNGAPWKVEAGGDPAGSWLSYAVYKAPKGGLINRVNTTWTVPVGKPTSRGSNAPGWWYGVQTAAGTGALVQPILACDYQGSSCKDGTYVIFDGVFDWTRPYEGMHESKIIKAKEGDKINSWLTCDLGTCTQYIQNVRTGEDATFPYKLHNPNKDKEAALYFVLEHQPSNCEAFPPKGVCTFENIYVEVEGKAVTPTWEAIDERPKCGSKFTVVDSKTLSVTWNGGTPPSASTDVVV